MNLQNAREKVLSKDGAMHTLKRSAPVPELLYFFICDVPEQDLWLVDVVPWRQDAGQVIALLQKVISQVQGLS